MSGVNNNHREHPLLNQDIVHHTLSIPTTAVLGTAPPELKHNNATTDKYGHVVPERVITIDSSSEDGDSPVKTQEAGMATVATMTTRKTHLISGT